MNSLFREHDVSQFPTTGLVSLESYLVTFPAEFDLRGQIEIPADSGLTLLYGRNGSGKSSILRTIKNSLSGVAPDSLEDPVCRLVLRLSDWDMGEPLDWYRNKELEGCRGFIRECAEAVLRHEGFEQDWEEQDYRTEFSRWASYLSDLDPELGSLPDGWFSATKALQRTSSVEDAYEECIQFVLRSRKRLLVVPMIEDSIFMSTVGPMKEGDQQFQRTLEVMRLTLEDPRLILTPSGTKTSPSWETEIAIPNHGPDSKAGRVIADHERSVAAFTEKHGADLFSELEAFESGDLPTALLREGRVSERWGKRFHPLYLVSDIRSTDLPFSFVDGNELPLVEQFLNSQLSGNYFEVAAAWVAYSRGLATVRQFEEGDTESGGLIFGDDADLDAVDEHRSESKSDESSDEEPTEESHIVAGPFGPVDLNSETLAENLEYLSRFGTNLRESLHLLGSCDIRISPNPMLHLCSDLDDLRVGKFVTIAFMEFPNLHGPFSVTFDQLSDGQQKLVCLAFAATAAVRDQSGKTSILIGDEVDNGFHVKAISGIYRMLGAMPISTLCSTHSIEAVAQSVGHRLHLTRDDASGMQLQTFDIQDAQVAAKQMGVAVSSLIAFIRLIVIVEGEHDRIVLESLLNAQNYSVGTEIQVLPIRGANNLMTALEAEFLDFTDSMVLVVLDNVRQDRLADVYAAGMSNSIGGGSADRRALFEARAKCAGHEEQIVGDIIVKRSRRGDLSRITFCGLSKRDIIEYLDPRDLGLSKSHDQLRSEYESLAESDPLSKTTFKDFVRVREGVRLGLDDITSAAENLENIHPDLGNVLKQIMSLLQKRSLELGFGI
jgi:ABC-type Mn2+/Zn2+ transport system ATPase subunit